AEEKTSYLKDIIAIYLKHFLGITFIAGEKTLRYDEGLFKTLVPVMIEFPKISYRMRRDIWKLFLKGSSLDNDNTDDDNVIINSLASKFAFTPKQILDAITIAKESISIQKGQSLDLLTVEDLHEGCRLVSNNGLSSLAHKVTPRYVWQDIILPTNRKAQLKEILDYVKYKNLVYLEWGFERKLSLGKGLNVLFAGESGTGKTMAAEIIANELKLDLYKIDLSSVVSKYIGETEKNLNQIFKEAET